MQFVQHKQKSMSSQNFQSEAAKISGISQIFRTTHSFFRSLLLINLFFKFGTASIIFDQVVSPLSVAMHLCVPSYGNSKDCPYKAHINAFPLASGVVSRVWVRCREVCPPRFPCSCIYTQILSNKSFVTKI